MKRRSSHRAAILPSSNKQRHTSRGCLCRTAREDHTYRVSSTVVKNDSTWLNKWASGTNVSLQKNGNGNESRSSFDVNSDLSSPPSRSKGTRQAQDAHVWNTGAHTHTHTCINGFPSNLHCRRPAGWTCRANRRSRSTRVLENQVPLQLEWKKKNPIN